ncbi:MAG: winged helix-turn-helix transcriptional regulator [Phycisphaerales bacterium]|nr:winged helix-turn-helix transcriptional regulator [Phycisphaerales bacterium]
MLIRPDQLARITHHRWSMPVLAELRRLGGGAKFVQLVHRLGGHRLAVDHSIHSLIELGLVIPNPGVGHPLRPEFILTPLGTDVAPVVEHVDDLLHRHDLSDLGNRKWTLPCLLAIHRGAERFGSMRDALGGATDRALSLCLDAMHSADLLVDTRDTSDRRSMIYALQARGRKIARPLADLPAIA